LEITGSVVVGMSQSYSVESLVEQPPIYIFTEMGWQTLSALEGVFGIGNGQSMEGTVHAFQRQTPNPRHTCDLLLMRLLPRKSAV